MDLGHLCWPFFDGVHREDSRKFEEWVSANLSKFERNEGGDGAAAREIFQLFGQSGWLEKTLNLDEPAAAAVDLRSMCLLREICAYSSAIADVALSEPWLAILPIVMYASQELRDTFLPAFFAGTLLPAFALSEPGAGSDAAAITTRAHLDGDHYVLNGRKTWTSNSGLADLYVIFARLEGLEGNCISAFAVDGNASGIVLEERLSVLPPHTVGTWRLDNVHVPIGRLIGQPGEGFKIAMRVLELFRPSVGAAMLGFSRRAMKEAVEYSLRRTTFRKPIAEHQLIQAKLANMATDIDIAALLVYRAAWLHDKSNKNISQAAAMAKYYSTEAGFQVIDQALQIFGGLGVVRGTTVERLFRHSRAFRIFDGTSEIQQLIIAKNILAGETPPA